MKDIKQIDLYKSRSYTACISEAFSTFAHNIKTIFKHTWLFSLMVAITFAAYTSTTTAIMTDSLTMTKGTLLIIEILLFMCAITILFARTAMLINMRPMAWNTKRSIRIMLTTVSFGFVIGLLFSIVGLIITGQSKPEADSQVFSATSWTLNIATLIIALLTLPYIYVFAKYMIEPETQLRRLVFRSYKTGFRHWAFIFKTMFLASMCMAVCAIITCLPVGIITSARIVSLNGTAMFSDPSGLPSYFNAMQFGLFALAVFIWSYINIFCLFIYFLMYGSIETREKEKKEFLNKQQ